MDIMTLELQSRTKEIRAKDLLRSSVIPAEYYGRGIQNKSLQVDYQTFRKLYRQAGGNTLIELNVDGKEKMTVLVHQVAFDPITDEITHIDFINVRMDQEIHTKIPLKFVGVSPAVKELGGIIVPNITELEVNCLPKDLVHSIEINIAPIIDFNHPIRVQDLVLPSGIKALHDLGEIVVTAVPPQEEEEATVAPVAPGAVPLAGESAAGEVAAGETAGAGEAGKSEAAAKPEKGGKEKK
ncbi:50S ribosomal protein L25 [Candidatus Peregrinibacteria bacterium]|nr:50S ribosomal protein L25 [Candidatus Peregrinibacteria bacterium]